MDMDKKSPAPLAIETVNFDQAIEERYLAYALSTIMSRSLPDVRDGLKPVHRRLIYAMQQLKLNPQSPFKKCARIVGDVMGKFHPHGDGAIYGALVRLAQDFSVRYPLIEGQGNFGNIDGDSAAAMRYTEARLSDTALLMMNGLEYESVGFRATYDGEGQEPVVFPSFFPNLLANGASGIAVGMATSIPPHNAEEIFQALEYLIDHPESETKDLLAFIKGPDFPTGGFLIESPESIRTSYETGRGSFRIRAHWFVEEQKGGTYKIIIDQIPYQVEKSKLVAKIATLILDRKNPFIEDIQDESTDDIRLVVYPKNRNVAPEVLMESLFEQTDLDVRFPFNMNALDATGTPRVMSLVSVLKAFLEHCQIVQEKEATYHLARIKERLNILTGLQIVYLNLDEVIRIIREEDDPKTELMQRFDLNVEQVESILNMRLRSLHKIQEIEIQKEVKKLSKEQASYTELLKSPKKQAQKLQLTFQTLREKFGVDTVLGTRRTVIAGPVKAIAIPEPVIEKENITIVCSSKNWVRVHKGHGIDAIKYKEGDSERFVIPCTTQDHVLLMGENGRVYTLEAHKIPRSKNNWESLRLLIDLPDTSEIVNMLIYTPKEEDETFLVANNHGYGFLVSAKDLLAQTKLGKQILNLKSDEVAHVFIPTADNDVAVVIGTHRKMVAFYLKELPHLTKGHGVILQKYKSALLSDIQLCKESEGFYWTRNGKTHNTRDLRAWLVRRGSLGRLPPPLFPRDNQFHWPI